MLKTNAVPRSALAADARFGGVWDHFRAWKCIGAQGCVLLALGRAQSAPQSAPRRPKVSKGTPKARF